MSQLCDLDQVSHLDRRLHKHSNPSIVLRFRVTKCEKPVRERRTLLILDSNGSVPASPTAVEPKSRPTFKSPQVCVCVMKMLPVSAFVLPAEELHFLCNHKYLCVHMSHIPLFIIRYALYYSTIHIIAFSCFSHFNNQRFIKSLLWCGADFQPFNASA